MSPMAKFQKILPAFPDIDYGSLTTRDIAEVLRRKGINPLTMPTTHEVKQMEKYTGAGTLSSVHLAVLWKLLFVQLTSFFPVKN